MKPLSFLFATLLLPAALFSQQVNVPLSIGLGYFGEMATHPGIQVGLEYPLVGDDWNRVYAQAELGLYLHPRNHTGLFADVGLGYRLQVPHAVSFDLALDVGYLHTWAAGTVYQVADDGSVTAPLDWGRPSLMPKVSADVGWEFDGPVKAAFVGLVGYGEYPYNGFLLPHFALSTGVQIQLDSPLSNR